MAGRAQRHRHFRGALGRSTGMAAPAARARSAGQAVVRAPSSPAPSGPAREGSRPKPTAIL
eukprot:6878097-Lingulodinium_polyedra.AAC.1